MENKESCLKNGKLTGLIIVITLIFAMVIFVAGLFLITYYDDTTDDNFKKPIWNLIYGSGIWIIVNGITAMVKRGWNFVQELLTIWKGKK